MGCDHLDDHGLRDPNTESEYDPQPNSYGDRYSNSDRHRYAHGNRNRHSDGHGHSDCDRHGDSNCYGYRDYRTADSNAHPDSYTDHNSNPNTVPIAGGAGPQPLDPDERADRC